MKQPMYSFSNVRKLGQSTKRGLQKVTTQLRHRVAVSGNRGSLGWMSDPTDTAETDTEVRKRLAAMLDTPASLEWIRQAQLRAESLTRAAAMSLRHHVEHPLFTPSRILEILEGTGPGAQGNTYSFDPQEQRAYAAARYLATLLVKGQSNSLILAMPKLPNDSEYSWWVRELQRCTHELDSWAE